MGDGDKLGIYDEQRNANACSFSFLPTFVKKDISDNVFTSVNGPVTFMKFD